MAASRTYSMIIMISKSWTKASLYYLQIEGSNKSYKLGPKKKRKSLLCKLETFFHPSTRATGTVSLVLVQVSCQYDRISKVF